MRFDNLEASVVGDALQHVCVERGQGDAHSRCCRQRQHRIEQRPTPHGLSTIAALSLRHRGRRSTDHQCSRLVPRLELRALAVDVGCGGLAKHGGDPQRFGARDRALKHLVEESEATPLASDDRHARLGGLARTRDQQGVMPNQLVTCIRDGARDVSVVHRRFNPNGTVKVGVDVAKAIAAVHQLRDRLSISNCRIANFDAFCRLRSRCTLGVGRTIDDGRKRDRVLGCNVERESFAFVGEVD